MGGNISPVLEAFLAGQKQQTGIIQQAKELQDQIEARKQRQQQIDEVIRQHNTEADQFHQRLDLEHQSHELEAKKAWMDTLQKGIANLKSGATPPQTGNIPTSLNIPGISADTQTQPTQFGNAPAVGGMQIPGINLQSPAINQVSPMQNVPNLNGGTSQVAMPLTNQAIADRAEQIANDKYQQTVMLKGKEDRDARQQIEDANRQQRADAAKDRVDALKDRNDILGAVGLGNIQHKQELDAAKELAKHGGLEPPEFAAQVEANAHDVFLGQKHLKDIQNPIERAQTERRVSELGGVDTPAKSVDVLLNAAGTAASYLSGINNVKEDVKNTNRFANTARAALPDMLTGLSPIKSNFETTIKPLITQLEQAQGISLARGGSSPAFFKLQAGMQPRLNDTPATMDFKGTSGAHLLLTEAAKSISNLPAPQQKALWRLVADKYPALLDNPTIAQKLVGKGGAVDKGLYDMANPNIGDFK